MNDNQTYPNNNSEPNLANLTTQPMNNGIENNPNMPNANNMNINQPVVNNQENNNNQFNIYDNNQISNAEPNLNSMNIAGDYNNLSNNNANNIYDGSKYINDQKVKDNIAAHKKNSVPISKELKTVVIISIILFLAIMFLPNLFDIISNIKFR